MPNFQRFVVSLYDEPRAPPPRVEPHRGTQDHLPDTAPRENTWGDELDTDDSAPDEAAND